MTPGGQFQDKFAVHSHVLFQLTLIGETSECLFRSHQVTEEPQVEAVQVFPAVAGVSCEITPLQHLSPLLDVVILY